jgi:hypothetical protein
MTPPNHEQVTVHVVTYRWCHRLMTRVCRSVAERDTVIAERIGLVEFAEFESFTVELTLAQVVVFTALVTDGLPVDTARQAAQALS